MFIELFIKKNHFLIEDTSIILYFYLKKYI